MNTKLISTLCVINCCLTELSTVLKGNDNRGEACSRQWSLFDLKNVQTILRNITLHHKEISISLLKSVKQAMLAFFHALTYTSRVDQCLRDTRRVPKSPTKYLQSTTLFSKTSGTSTGSQKLELQA